MNGSLGPSRGGLNSQQTGHTDDCLATFRPDASDLPTLQEVFTVDGSPGPFMAALDKKQTAGWNIELQLLSRLSVQIQEPE